MVGVLYNGYRVHCAEKDVRLQARLAELDAERRAEHLRRLEELKRHLQEIEKQVKILHSAFICAFVSHLCRFCFFSICILCGLGFYIHIEARFTVFILKYAYMHLQKT